MIARSLVPCTLFLYVESRRTLGTLPSVSEASAGDTSVAGARRQNGVTSLLDVSHSWSPIVDNTIRSVHGSMPEKTPWKIKFYGDSILYKFSQGSVESSLPSLAGDLFWTQMRRKFKTLEPAGLQVKASDIQKLMAADRSGLWHMGYAHREGLEAVSKFVDAQVEYFTCTAIVKLKLGAGGRRTVDSVYVFREDHLEALINSIGVFMNMVTFSPVKGCELIPRSGLTPGSNGTVVVNAAAQRPPPPSIPRESRTELDHCTRYIEKIPRQFDLASQRIRLSQFNMFDAFSQDYLNTADDFRKFIWSEVSKRFNKRQVLVASGEFPSTFAEGDRLFQATFMDLTTLLRKQSGNEFLDDDTQTTTKTVQNLNALRGTVQQEIQQIYIEGGQNPGDSLKWLIHSCFNALAKLSVLEQISRLARTDQEKAYVQMALRHMFGSPDSPGRTTLFDSFSMPKAESDMRRECMIMDLFVTRKWLRSANGITRAS